MSEFKNYHPLVNFAYFAAVIVFSMIFTNPICESVGFLAAFSYSVKLGGKKSAVSELLCILPIAILSALLNPMFNHEGVTIIAYLPSGNPLTLESIACGLGTALMLSCVICIFSCFNKIMTSDKFMYLFGKMIPSLSLILSMTLRFVPRFTERAREIGAAQECIGRSMHDGGIITRTKNAIRQLSILITWSMENAIETADSMKSRGFGTGKRTAFSNFKLERRDIYALAALAALAAYIIWGAKNKAFAFRYFPSIVKTELSPYAISVFCAYLVLFCIPIILEITEEIRWRRSESKI